MVGGAAERQRHAAAGQHRQQCPEQRRIFQRKQCAQPGLPGIGDDQRRLQAGDIVRCLPELAIGLAQLVGMWPVLGVVDGEIVAARGRQGIGQRLRLGARRHRRNLDDLEMRRQVEGFQGQNGGVIVRLADQLDVEPRGRPAQPPQCRHQLRRYLFLAIERHHDRVDRQVAQRRQGRDRRRRLAAMADGAAFDQEGQEIEQRQHDMDHVDRWARRQQEAGNHRGDAEPGIKPLPPPEHHPRRKMRLPFEQAGDGVAHAAHSPRLPDGGAQRRGGDDDHIGAQARIAREQRHGLRQPPRLGRQRRQRAFARALQPDHHRARQLAVERGGIRQPPFGNLVEIGKRQEVRQSGIIGRLADGAAGQQFTLQGCAGLRGALGHFGDQRLANAEATQHFALDFGIGHGWHRERRAARVRRFADVWIFPVAHEPATPRHGLRLRCRAIR